MNRLRTAEAKFIARCT